MPRDTLPHRRPVETHSLSFANIEITCSFGYTLDPGPAIREVFLDVKKQAGSPFSVAVRDIGILISLLLQYGASPRVIERALTKNADGEAEGLAGRIAKMIEENGNG